MYQAKYNMSREQNVFWAKRNIVDYIWKSANLEGTEVTFPDTHNIYEGITTAGVSVADVVKINNLKHAWQLEATTESVVKEELAELFQEENPMNRALNLCLYCMRKQMFLDGNKRVAMLAANQILIKEGMGILTVAQENMEEFKEKLIPFYETNQKEAVKQFLCEKCIDGVDMGTEFSRPRNYTEEYFRKKSRELSLLGKELESEHEIG